MRTWIWTLVASGLVTAASAQACSTYDLADGVCRHVINYPVRPKLPTVGDTEKLLIASGVDYVLETALAPFPSCFDAFFGLHCALAFPECAANGTIANPPCKSDCERVKTSCDELFAAYNLTYRIPQCNADMPGTSIPWSTDVSQCSPRKQVLDNRTMVDVGCPEPLVRNPVPNGPCLKNQICLGACCMRCPHMEQLFPPNKIGRVLNVTDTMRGLSAILAFILLCSLLIARQMPSEALRILQSFVVAMFLFCVASFISLGRRLETQCAADGITQSDQSNNLSCTVQGAMNVFGSGACICTCSAVLLNLHCKTVWNSDIISRNFKYIGPISWAIPMVMTVVALDLTEISYEFGSACFLKHRRALIIFFYPYLPVIGLGVLLHASTLMYVCKIAFLADRHAIFIPSETITGSWDGTSGTRRRVLQLWKTSWRSMALVTVYLASFAYYWYFYVQDAIPQKISMDTKVSWLTCILSPGGSQEKCSPIITPSVTSLRLLILAEMIPGLLGTWTFIIFGFRKAILAEWKEFFRIRRSRWFNLSRERRRQRRKDVRPACPISTAVANRRRTYRSPTAARNSLLDPEYEIDVQAENQPHLPYAFDGPMAGKPVEGLAWPVRAAGREMSRAAGLDGSLTNPFIVKSSHHRGRTDGSHTNIDDLLTNSSLTSLSRGTTVLKDEEESGGLPLALLPSTVTRASLSSQRSDTTTLTYPSPPSRHISHLSYFSVTPPNETQQAHDELDLQQRLSHSQLQYSTQSPWR